MTFSSPVPLAVAFAVMLASLFLMFQLIRSARASGHVWRVACVGFPDEAKELVLQAASAACRQLGCSQAPHIIWLADQPKADYDVLVVAAPGWAKGTDGLLPTVTVDLTKLGAKQSFKLLQSAIVEVIELAIAVGVESR